MLNISVMRIVKKEGREIGETLYGLEESEDDAQCSENHDQDDELAEVER